MSNTSKVSIAISIVAILVSAASLKVSVEAKKFNVRLAVSQRREEYLQLVKEQDGLIKETKEVISQVQQAMEYKAKNEDIIALEDIRKSLDKALQESSKELSVVQTEKVLAIEDPVFWDEAIRRAREMNRTKKDALQALQDSLSKLRSGN